MKKTQVFFNECQICGRGSMTVICSDFCASVRTEWVAGKYGNVTLREAFRMARDAVDTSAACLDELKGDGIGRLLCS